MSLTAEERALLDSLTDEDLERAREECEPDGDGFAVWQGMTSQGLIKITYKAVEFWEPQGRCYPDRLMVEVQDEEFVEAMK